MYDAPVRIHSLVPVKVSLLLCKCAEQHCLNLLWKLRSNISLAAPQQVRIDEITKHNCAPAVTQNNFASVKCNHHVEYQAVGQIDDTLFETVL